MSFSMSNSVFSVLSHVSLEVHAKCSRDSIHVIGSAKNSVLKILDISMMFRDFHT